MKPLSLTDRRMIALKILNKVRKNLIERNKEIMKTLAFRTKFDELKEHKIITLANRSESLEKEIKNLRDKKTVIDDMIIAIATEEDLINSEPNFGYLQKNYPEGKAATYMNRLIIKHTDVLSVPEEYRYIHYDRDVNSVATDLLEFADGGITNAVETLVDSIYNKYVGKNEF